MRSIAPILSLLLATACDGPSVDADTGIPPGTDAPASDAPSIGPMSDLVDPMCVDGMYRERLPDRSQSIDDLVTGYTSAGATTFVTEVLLRRYPLGNRFVTTGRFGGMNCAELFFRDRSTAQAAFRQLSTLVHECGHAVDSDLRTFTANTYVVSSDIELTCSMGDTTSRGGRTFERSRIRNDEYQAMRPACAPGTFMRGCDFYANTYLDGNPDDGTFDSGDQGFNSVIEEFVQYVNSLATDYAVGDYVGRGGSSVSDRDGLLTFMWYVERYLRMARLMYPMAYEHLLNGEGGCWRRAVLTVWGRAVVYLDATEGMPGLGIDDAAVMSQVRRPELLEEIERLRTAEGCP